MKLRRVTIPNCYLEQSDCKPKALLKQTKSAPLGRCCNWVYFSLEFTMSQIASPPIQSWRDQPLPPAWLLPSTSDPGFYCKGKPALVAIKGEDPSVTFLWREGGGTSVTSSKLRKHQRPPPVKIKGFFSCFHQECTWARRPGWRSIDVF